MKVDPVSDARVLAAIQVRQVHVTRGWTVLVKDLGRLAPNTKEESVAERRKEDWSTLIHFDVGEFLIKATEDIPVTNANALRVRNNFILKAFGGGLVTGVVEATNSVTSFVSGVSLPPPRINFLTPRTDQLVVKRVNRNPPTITENNFSTCFGENQCS